MEAAQGLKAAQGMEAALIQRTVLELNKKYLKKNTLLSFGDKTLMDDSKLNEIKASQSSTHHFLQTISYKEIDNI